MELLLHFGLYKTGSSYLQTVCARNRDALHKESIFFPPSSREEDMLAGKISPGNGNGLTQFIQYEDSGKLMALLKRWIQAAKAKNYEKILISDEALIHAFAAPGSLSFFNEITRKAGISSVSCFAFFRDPIEHCLSTFKHRAKKGAITSFEDWIENGYETMQRLRSFLQVYDSVPFKWLFRKYQRNSDEMIRIFFKDWLQLQSDFVPVEIMVNPSLTLSEIAVIQQASQFNDRLPFHLYDRFIELSPDKKGRDGELEKAYRAIVFRKIKNDIDVISRLNDVLISMGSDPLSIEEAPDESGNIKSVMLTRYQVDAILDAAEYSKKYHVYILDKLRFTKRKLKRKIKKYSF